jgi:hypothetical protein
MVFARKQWRLVVHVQLAILILAIVLSLLRVIRRVGDDLEIWTVFRLRRLKVKQVYLCVVSHTGGKGGATIAALCCN